MTKYLIYTTAQVEPFEVIVDYDITTLIGKAVENESKFVRITHTKENMMGSFKYDVLLNLENIVSITTSKKL